MDNFYSYCVSLSRARPRHYLFWYYVLSSDKTDLLERRLRDLTAEVDELKEERDRKMTAVNSQLHEQNGVINK